MLHSLLQRSVPLQFSSHSRPPGKSNVKEHTSCTARVALMSTSINNCCIQLLMARVRMDSFHGPPTRATLETDIHPAVQTTALLAVAALVILGNSFLLAADRGALVREA